MIVLIVYFYSIFCSIFIIVYYTAAYRMSDNCIELNTVCKHFQYQFKTPEIQVFHFDVSGATLGNKQSFA